MRKDELTVDGLYRSVRKVIEQGRRAVSIAANAVLVRQNWSIGKLIVEDEQHGRRKADYGKKTLEALSSRLTAEYGSGYTLTNLKYMRQFYLTFPIRHALRDELGWTHYRILMREDDPIAREWYMNECVAAGWGSRDLDRQVATDAYHRLLAAANPDRRRKLRELPLTKLPEKPKSLVPADFIKNPMMLEFLSLPQDVKIRETKLESAIISHLKDVMMELGRGFSFVARQKHMRSGSDDYFIDLVFYNYILKCFFLFDLKMGKVTHKDVGQMDMYRRMFDDQVCGKDDNPTVGIVLCDETDAAIARYSVLHDNKNMFAVKYSTVMPPEDVLRREIEIQKELYQLQMESDWDMGGLGVKHAAKVSCGADAKNAKATKKHKGAASHGGAETKRRTRWI